MADEKTTQVTEQPDIEQFCQVISGYVEFCNQTTKTKLTEKNKEGLSPSEISENEEELKNQKKSCQKAFDAMCVAISEGGISHLNTFIDAAKRLYEEKADWKRDIKAMLVGPQSLKLFREARTNLVELYPLLMKVNKTFPVDDYSELSISPKAALYGSEVNKTHNSSTKKSPLKNEDIQAMLDAFLQVKDHECFEKWILSILYFEPSQIVDVFQRETAPKRKQLRDWVLGQCYSNNEYYSAVMDALIKENRIKDLLDAYIAKPSLMKKQAELEEKIKALEASNSKNKEEFEKHNTEQRLSLQDRDANIAELQSKILNFERCKQELTKYIERYQAQVGMNERLVAENIRRLSDMETKCGHMQDELTESQSRLDSIKTEYSALQSDYSLKNNELMRVKELAAQKEETSRVDIMRELVSGINEQFFYLTMFYLELKDTGRLEPESIELFADTLENIDGVLMGLGIKKIGSIEQKVAYDASIHISTDAKIANGEQVVIRGYGWKIGDAVYIKAPVEKGD